LEAAVRQDGPVPRHQEPDRVADCGVDASVVARTGPVAERQRLGLVDALRGLAAAVIAAHHICLYDPLPDRAAELLPQVINWFRDYGRLAVQVFFVISGVVMALSVGRTRIGPAEFARFATRRYVRLGFPYLAAILYLLALRALIPQQLSTFPLFDELTWELILSHLFFLQDILGYPSLSAGFWYLGIDFQFSLLFCLLILLHQGLVRALRVRSRRFDVALLLALSAPFPLLSIYIFNLNPSNDVWASYYLGSLFVGVMCGWALAGRIPRGAFWAYAGAVVVGLIVHWRSRLALALATGVLIYCVGRGGRISDWAVRPPLRPLGRISYSLFLVHYPTTWAVESLGSRLWGDSAAAALLGMVLAFVASLAAAVVLFRLVERPSQLLAERLRRGGWSTRIEFLPSGRPGR
jgi:peptidoglycan/LPS O-acetylase OafA/YrhL